MLTTELHGVAQSKNTESFNSETPVRRQHSVQVE